MGILDELLKKGKETVDKLSTEENKEKAKDLLQALGETAGDLVNAVKSVDTNELKEAFGNLISEAAEEKSEKPAVGGSDEPAKHDMGDYAGVDRENYDIELPEDDLDCKAKILEVLAADFPEYEVKEAVSPVTIGGQGKFMDYTLAIYKNSQPKLFIMIIEGSQGRLRTYRWSKEQAEKAGITMINFLRYSPNRYWYIKERLNKYL